MPNNNISSLFTREILDDLLPAGRADDFFKALFGDVDEGAYDISLHFSNYNAEKNILSFELHMQERPGKCLSCNLTYGLPQVFSRHPVINIAELVKGIMRMLNKNTDPVEWKIGPTREISEKLHVIPIDIFHGA